METTKYTTEEMNTMFTAILNKDHWKNPVYALIDWRAFDLASQAVEFYTGTKLEVLGGPEQLTGRILVGAPGYYAGPCN